MSIVKTYQIDTDSSESTSNLAAKIGAKLKGGEIIELMGDLGSGKTVFVRGLARGMGSKDQVASPTFTISREYKSGKLELHHFDFYRLEDAGVIAEELAESIENPSVAVAIEWSGAVKSVLPEDRLQVEITRIGDESRKLQFRAGTKHSRLLNDVAAGKY